MLYVQEAALGKKGRCPTCKHIFQLAAETPAPKTPVASPAASTPEAPTDRVVVLCPRCSQDLHVLEATLGKKGRCPTCHHIFQLQRATTSATAPAIEAPTIEASAPFAERVEVHCPCCSQMLNVLATTLGKKGRCPTCQHIFQLQQDRQAVAQPELTLAGEAPPVTHKLEPLPDLMPLTPISAPTARVEARVEVACPACTQTLHVLRSTLGKKGRCPTCQETFELQESHALPALQEDQGNGLIDMGLTPLGSAANVWNAFDAQPHATNSLPSLDSLPTLSPLTSLPTNSGQSAAQGNSEWAAHMAKARQGLPLEPQVLAISVVVVFFAMCFIAIGALLLLPTSFYLMSILTITVFDVKMLTFLSLTRISVSLLIGGGSMTTGVYALIQVRRYVQGVRYLVGCIFCFSMSIALFLLSLLLTLLIIRLQFATIGDVTKCVSGFFTAYLFFVGGLNCLQHLKSR